MDRQRHAVIVMLLVVAFGGAGVFGLMTLDPGDATTAPDNTSPPRPRPVQKKKADPKDKVPVGKPAENTNSTAPEVAPPPRPAKRPLTLDEKKAVAQKQCKLLADAIEAYRTSPSNPKREFPNRLEELFQPPFGGRPFLADAAETRNDPWGKEYEFALFPRADGTAYYMVYTMAPDLTPISQFGIAMGSFPPG